MAISRVHLAGEAVASAAVGILAGLSLPLMEVKQSASVDIFFAYAPGTGTGVTLKMRVYDADGEVVGDIMLNAGDAIDGVPANSTDPAVGDGFTCSVLMYPGLTYDFFVSAAGTLVYLQVDEVS